MPPPELHSPAVTPDSAATCSCCGDLLTDTDRIDARFGLPDVALGASKWARRHVNGGLLRVLGRGRFVRCLLPVQLSGGLELVLGTWMQISGSDLRRAYASWEKPAYAELRLTGTLANGIMPWGDDLLGADLTAVVRNIDEVPYADASTNPLLSRVLHTRWDRDEVLGCFGHPLTVPVQTRLDGYWTIERSAGMEARVVNNASQFSSGDRHVHVELLELPSGRTQPESLAALLDCAPGVDATQQLTETVPGGVRHAFWRTTDGRQPHELHGFVIRGRDGVALACRYRDARDLAWAQHVWRSVTHTEPPPA